MSEFKHYLYAVGLGVATALALIPMTGTINWREVGVEGGKALLYGLGVVALTRKT